MAEPVMTAEGGGDMTRQALMQLMLERGQQGTEAEPKRPARWMFFIPGFGKGYAQGKKIEGEEEELKLRKQQISGQKAAQQLQQITMMRKLEQEEKRKRFASLYGGLIKNEDTLDDAARSELEGTLAQEMAELGDLPMLTKFEEARLARRQERQIAQIEGGSTPAAGQATPQAPAMPEAPGDAAAMPEGEEEAGEAPALTMPPVTVEAQKIQAGVQASKSAFQRDTLRLTALDKEEAAIRQRLEGYRKIGGTKRIESRMSSTRQQLKDVQAEKSSLQKRMQFAGTPIEQVTGIPQAYMTSEEVIKGGLELQKRKETVSSKNQAAGLGVLAEKTYQAAMAKNRAELEGAPLDAGVAEKVSTLNTAIMFINDIGDLYKQDFTGKVASVGGDIREFTGNPKQDETEFRRVVKDVEDYLLRARSGAAITPQEYARMKGLVPGIRDEPKVFVSKLKGLGKAIEQARDDKLKIATTARKALIESSPKVAPLPEGKATLPAPGGFKILGIEEKK